MAAPAKPLTVSKPSIKHEWFFDDRADAQDAAAGEGTGFMQYDRTYSMLINQYSSRAAHYRAEHPNRPDIEKMADSAVLAPERAREILAIIGAERSPLCADLTPQILVQALNNTWRNISTMGHLFHRATFDPNAQDAVLVAVLVVLGMAVSDNTALQEVARAAYHSVLMVIRRRLSNPQKQDDDLHTRLNLLQAVTIVNRYDSTILANQTPEEGDEQCREWVLENHLWSLISDVNSLGAVSHRRPNVDPRNLPKHAWIQPDGYYFRESTDPVAQWKEWTLYEACKRVAHFALYCDCVHTLSNGGATTSQLTIFDVDTQMPCAQDLWEASTFDEFMYIVGPERVLRNVPYLSVIKSMLRLPRVDDPPITDVPYQAQWSIFALAMVLYGLLCTSRTMTGTSTTDADIKRKLQTSGRGDGPDWFVNFFDRGIQVRLSRAFEMWSQYFELSTGSDPYHIMNKRITSEGALGDTQSRQVSSQFLDYILLVLLHHHAAMIMMHEELRLIADVGNGLPHWLAANDGVPLAARIPFDLYIQWAKTREARYVVSVACLFLVRISTGQKFLHPKKAENFLLSVVTYYSVLTVWLYSLALGFEDQHPELADAAGTVSGDRIMADASSYLHHVWELTYNSRHHPVLGLGVLDNTSSSSSTGGHSPITQANAPPMASVSSVVALGALLLRDMDIGQPQPGGDILYALYRRLNPRASLTDFGPGPAQSSGHPAPAYTQQGAPTAAAFAAV